MKTSSPRPYSHMRRFFSVRLHFSQPGFRPCRNEYLYYVEVNYVPHTSGDPRVAENGPQQCPKLANLFFSTRCYYELQAIMWANIHVQVALTSHLREPSESDPPRQPDDKTPYCVIHSFLFHISDAFSLSANFECVCVS